MDDAQKGKHFKVFHTASVMKTSWPAIQLNSLTILNQFQETDSGGIHVRTTFFLLHLFTHDFKHMQEQTRKCVPTYDSHMSIYSLSSDKILQTRCDTTESQTSLLLGSRVGRGGLLQSFFSLAMGDKGPGQNCPPGIYWASYSTPPLLETIQRILIVLSERAAEVADSDWQVEAGSTAASSQAPIPPRGNSGGALLEPWTCGFRCKHCQNRCTRREGHSNHSCWDCRHKRH